MKANKLIAVLLFILVTMVIVIGCKYDVAEPLWEKPAVVNAETPSITLVVPDEALPGVNTITIHGKDFNDSLSRNIVYFDNFIAEIQSNTDSTITVYRPNIATNSASIKVVSDGALAVAKYGSPYKVSPVLQKWGSFLENVELSVAAVDDADTLYVVSTSARKIYKITPSGDKTPLKINDTTETVLPWVPADMRFGPNGNLYITAASTSREIAMINIRTGVATTRWRYLVQGRLAKYCDFGDNGFLYLGGGNDLYYLNLSTAPTGSGINATYAITVSGLYPTPANTILGLRVYSGYVYVSAIKGTSRGIWRHQINPNGTLAAGSLVLDWNTTKYGTPPVTTPPTLIRDIKNFAVASDLSTIYVQVRDSIERVENLVVVKPQGIESVYRGIVRPYGQFFDWSKNSNYLYMIGGSTSPSEEWNVYRVDVGAKSASRLP